MHGGDFAEETVKWTYLLKSKRWSLIFFVNSIEIKILVMESIRYGNAKEKNVNGIGARKRNTVNAYSVLNIK